MVGPKSPYRREDTERHREEGYVKMEQVGTMYL